MFSGGKGALGKNGLNLFWSNDLLPPLRIVLGLSLRELFRTTVVATLCNPPSKVLDLMKSDFSIQEEFADFKQVGSFIKCSKQNLFEKSTILFLLISLATGFKILFTSFSPFSSTD